VLTAGVSIGVGVLLIVLLFSFLFDPEDELLGFFACALTYRSTMMIMVIMVMMMMKMKLIMLMKRMESKTNLTDK
jgi:hypothetical protein